MQQRREREQIHGVLLLDAPADPRLVCSRVPERAEHALTEVREARVLAPLRLGPQLVKGEQRKALRLAKRLVDELRSVRTQAGQLSQLLRDALGRLKDRVKVVVRKQLGGAEAQDVGVNPAPPQLSLQPLRPALRFAQRPRDAHRPKRPVLAE